MNRLIYSIENATWRDLGAVRHIEQVCFPKDAWPLLDLIGSLTMPNLVRLKATVNQDGRPELVGLIIGDVKRDQDVSWIATIAVLPAYRRQGIGAALLRACEAQFPTHTVRLNVRVSNLGAILMYEKYGYRRAGTWPAYYVDHEDALVMEKAL